MPELYRLRVLLDKNVRQDAAKDVFGGIARSPKQEGLHPMIGNGDLVRVAMAREFDVLITGDKNMALENRTMEITIPVAILDCMTNSFGETRALMSALDREIAENGVPQPGWHWLGLKNRRPHVHRARVGELLLEVDIGLPPLGDALEQAPPGIAAGQRLQAQGIERSR